MEWKRGKIVTFTIDNEPLVAEVDTEVLRGWDSGHVRELLVLKTVKGSIVVRERVGEIGNGSTRWSVFTDDTAFVRDWPEKDDVDGHAKARLKFIAKAKEV